MWVQIHPLVASVHFHVKDLSHPVLPFHQQLSVSRKRTCSDEFAIFFWSSPVTNAPWCEVLSGVSSRVDVRPPFPPESDTPPHIPSTTLRCLCP